MFTENESDTINFPEISKEVLEEVSPRACAVATVWGNEVGCSLAPAVRQVIKYFYYKLRYANEPMPPEFPIEPSMALELLMA